MNRLIRIYLFLFSMLITACSTSPTGRRQLTLLPEEQMSAMGEQAFTDLKGKLPVEKDPSLNHYVQCISNNLTENLKIENAPKNWEVVVFQDPSPNAFALPGGKIGVHTGLLNVAKTPDQLAAVIGHEIGHVIAQHGNARVSESLIAQGGLQILSAVLAERSTRYNLLMAGLGLGAQYGILMPHSRSQETEADIIGLELMAESGFDPQASIALWKNMAETGKAQPPEFLSTHPSHGTRMETLKSHMKKAREIASQNASNATCGSRSSSL